MTPDDPDWIDRLTSPWLLVAVIVLATTAGVVLLLI